MKFTEKDILQTFKNFDLINNDNKMLDITSAEKIELYYFELTNLTNEDDNKTIRQKRDYLCNYLLDDMIKADEITEEQKNEFCLLYGINNYDRN